MYTSASKKAWIKKRWSGNSVQQKKEKNFSLRKNMPTKSRSKNTMVLEISATPYIFTFKLWDWGRLGMDGLPRPIHLDHGMKNIQWNRDTKWVYDNIVGQQKTLEKTENCEVERTGLHSREFIDTIRYTLSGPHTVSMDDTVHVMNLVEGRSVRIESMDGSFAPFTVHYAETAIVPAAVGTYRIVPEEGEMIKMLVASVG